MRKKLSDRNSKLCYILACYLETSYIFVFYFLRLFVCLSNLWSLNAKSWYYNKMISGVNVITLDFQKADKCLAPCKRIQDSLGFLDSTPWIPDFRYFWFWIPIFIGIQILYAVFWIPKIRIRDSTRKLRIRESGLPYIGQIVGLGWNWRAYIRRVNKNNG